MIDQSYLRGSLPKVYKQSAEGIPVLKAVSRKLEICRLGSRSENLAVDPRQSRLEAWWLVVAVRRISQTKSLNHNLSLSQSH